MVFTKTHVVLSTVTCCSSAENVMTLTLVLSVRSRGGSEMIQRQERFPFTGAGNPGVEMAVPFVMLPEHPTRNKSVLKKFKHVDT